MWDMKTKFCILFAMCALLLTAGALAAEPGTGTWTADIRVENGLPTWEGEGVSWDGEALVLTQAGSYRLQGALPGYVRVECAGVAELLLCGFSAQGASCAIYSEASVLTLTLAADFGENRLSQAGGSEDGAAIVCKGGLVIRGEGALSLEAAGRGIQCKDSRLAEGLFRLESGALSVTAGKDGIKAATAELLGGALTVNAALDGLHSELGTLVSGGEYAITCGNGGGLAINRQTNDMMGGGPALPGASMGSEEQTEDSKSTVSCKALKSDGDIEILGGVLRLGCDDDAVHAAGDLIIEDGNITISCNDDGLHADGDITINGGRILLEDCFEGIEGTNITINGGDIDVFSVNDGLNTSSGEMGFSPFGGSSTLFAMNGGELDIVITGNVSNQGDGVDANGSFHMNGGRLTASTASGTLENGLDSGSNFLVTGGILAASGNSGMQESASDDSTQPAAVLSLGATVPGGTECVITDSAGSVVMTYTPAQQCTCLIVSHPDFQIGESYTLTAGTVTTEFTFDTVSYSSSGEMGGGPGPGGNRGGRMASGEASEEASGEMAG